MRLDLERKENGAGGCEGETRAPEHTHPEPHNCTHSSNNNHSNNNNNNNNNNSTRNSNQSRGYREGESETHGRDQCDEAGEETNEQMDQMDRRGPFSHYEENTPQRETITTIKDMELDNFDDRRRVVDSGDTMTMIISQKSRENGTVTEPMLDKTRLSENTHREGKKLYQYMSTLIAGLMAMQSGMALGWTSPILPYLKSKESFLTEGLTETKESWVCSLLAAGAVLGAVPAGKIADRIGRKATIVVTALPFLISWLMIIFLRDLTSLYLARFIGGIGAGAACVLVPVYIGEVAEASIRGALGAFFPLLFSLGIVYVYVMGAYTTYTIYNVTCCLALVPFFVLVYLLPESPMWLVHRGRMKQAAESLRALRGKDYEAREEIGLLQIEADRLENRRGGMRDLIGTRAGRRALVTCVGLMWFQQMSGIDAVLVYTVSIFQDADSTIEPYIATIIIGIVEVVMSIVVATVIDRFGRKPLLVLSGTGMSICLGILGYYFQLKDHGSDVSTIGWLPLTCLALFNIVFSVGYGSVPFAVISELFPPETKGVASSISIMVNWSLVFTVTKIFPTMVEYMGQAATFWTFGFMTAMSAVFAFLLVPETKGKTLQEIQAKLEFRKEKTQTSTINKESA